jgi:hypothetical protein
MGEDRKTDFPDRPRFFDPDVCSRAFLGAAACWLTAAGLGCSGFPVSGQELPGVAPASPASATVVLRVEPGLRSITFPRDAAVRLRASRTTRQEDRSYLPTDIAAHWRLHGLISEWVVPGEFEPGVTHRLRAEKTIDQDFQGHVVLFILTAGLIPLVERISVDIEVTLQRMDEGQVSAQYEASAKNSWTYWYSTPQWVVGILSFGGGPLPPSPVPSRRAVEVDAERDRALHLYEELGNAGAFD